MGSRRPTTPLAASSSSTQRMGCVFVVRPGQERRGLADTLTLFPRQSTSVAH